MLLNYSIFAGKVKEWMSSKVVLVFGKMSKRALLNFVRPCQCSICLNSSCSIAMNIQVLKVNTCNCEVMFQIQKLCIIDNLTFLFCTVMSTSCIKRIIWLLQWWSSCWTIFTTKKPSEEHRDLECSLLYFEFTIQKSSSSISSRNGVHILKLHNLAHRNTNISAQLSIWKAAGFS